MVARQSECPFASVVAGLLAGPEAPFVVTLGAVPASLAQFLANGRARGLLLEHSAEALGARLYRQDVRQVDLLWLGSDAEALGGLDFVHLAPSRIWLDPRALGAEALARAADILVLAGYELSKANPGLLARRMPLVAADADALLALGDRLEMREALPLLRLLAPWHAEGRRRLIAALTGMGLLMEALYWAAPWPGEAGPAAEAASQAFNRCLAAHDIAGAERHAAALALAQPGNIAVLEAALACNRSLGHVARGLRFAEALLEADTGHLGAHLALLDHRVAQGDRIGELASRTCLALAPDGGLHPLRRLHEAHRALSLHLLHPLDAANRPAVQALVSAVRAIDPDVLAEGEARNWARHYRHLTEAADAALLGRDVPLIGVERVWRSTGRELSWPQLRRLPEARDVEAVFVVAADAAYLRLYGRPYLTSVLRHADVAAMILVHVIGGLAQMPMLIGLLDLDDLRVFFTADAFAVEDITTRCHDSDGPRALPVAHFQCTRFAVARRVMQELRHPVFVSDIDVVLQRGVRDLLEGMAGRDIVLNRNEASQSFGSHITANLLLAFPTEAGLGFMAELHGYLEGALAAPHVTRWIDQCGLQLCWNARAETTRFGWFDTATDINNVMYPRYMPNPFRFLSLFHGFDMSSLPVLAA